MEGQTGGNSAPPDKKQLALTEYRKKLAEHREYDAKVKSCKSCFLYSYGLTSKWLTVCMAFSLTAYSAFGAARLGKDVWQDGRRHQSAAVGRSDYWRGAEAAGRGAVYCKGLVGTAVCCWLPKQGDKEKLKQGTRVALDMTTLTIMRILPREVDPLVYNMSLEETGDVSFAGIGGLSEQIRELREVSRVVECRAANLDDRY